MPLTTTTTADTMIPELWSVINADAREAELSLLSLFDRRYEQEASAKAYDRIRIQGFNNFTDETGTFGSTLGVGGTLTYAAGRYQTQVTLIIDTHVYEAFDLEYEAELLTNVAQLENLAHKAGYSVAHRLDDDAAGFIDDFDSPNVVGTLLVGLSDADVSRAQQYLDDNYVPAGDRYFVFSHAEKRSLMDQEKYINSNYREAVGSLNNNVIKGYINHIHGADWIAMDNIEGTNSAGHDNGMFHREAVAVAVIDNMRTEQMYEIDTDSTKYVVHSIYGMIEVRGLHGVFCRGL